MSEYYGISTPSSDFFMHYGVQGMKWGVRKAIESGNSRALSRHFRKAAKKLAKLNNQADRGHQQNIIKAAKRDQKIAAGIGGASVGIAGARSAISLQNAYRSALQNGVGVGAIYAPVGAIPAAAGIIGGSIRKRNAKNRLSDIGHRQAVRERNQFRKEMQKAFKGTEYARQIDSRANAIANKRKDYVISRMNKYDREEALKNRYRKPNKHK